MRIEAAVVPSLLGLWLAAVAWIGCSPVEPAGLGAAASGAGGGDAGAVASSSSVGGAMKPEPRVASIIAGTVAGEAPAGIWMSNDSGVIVSLQLGGAEFWQHANDEPDVMQHAASATVASDFRLGWHEAKTEGSPCVFLDGVSYDGPVGLVPGEGYRFVVSGEDIDDLAIRVDAEAAPTPFVALRGRVDFSATLKTLWAELDDGNDVELILVTGVAGPFAIVEAPTASVTALRYEDAGGRYRASLTASLGDARGYTIVVGETPLADAVATGVLEPLP